MADKQQKLQKATPKGINPKTGKPYEVVNRAKRLALLC